ncbi:hypothetical protein MHU86_22455 [Fragilaria crotonensis]|nr:hypothetical protein MHU86_22455 [Fragilaria crotonensis]
MQNTNTKEADNVAMRVGISAVISMDEEGTTPKATSSSNHSTDRGEGQLLGIAEHMPTRNASHQQHPEKEYGSKTSPLVVANISHSSSSTSHDSANLSNQENHFQETTLIGQDYLSMSPSQDYHDDSLPMEAFNADAMNDILKDLGESFLNASVLQDNSPIKEQYDGDDRVEQEESHQESQDDNQDTFQYNDNDQTMQDNSIYTYPFPPGHANIHQVTDSSLLQASLTSEASSSPSPTSKPSEWQSYKSRNRQLQDRNASLLKEIRFAEQTCVELSHDKYFVDRELAHVQRMLEEEFASKTQLLQKLEHMAETHDALEQELKQERKRHDEIAQQLDQERQGKFELIQELEHERQNHGNDKQEDSDALLLVREATEQLAKERQDKLDLMEQVAEARLSNEDIQTQLDMERQTKVTLKNALHQALHRIQQLQQEQQQDHKQAAHASPPPPAPDSEVLLQRVAELESKLELAQQQQEQQREEKAALESQLTNLDTPNPSSNETRILKMRIEELESQNAHLRRGYLKMDEPDGVLPARTARPKPDAPDVVKGDKHVDVATTEDPVDVAHRAVAEVNAKLELTEREFLHYKEREQERLDSACMALQQQQIELTTKYNDLQKENQRLDEELSHQRLVTAGLSAWNQDSAKEVKEDKQRLEQELLQERHTSAELGGKLIALQKEYNRVAMSDMSLRSSLDDVKARLTHVMEHELAVSQRRCHSLEHQLMEKDKEIHLKIQSERNALRDEFIQVLRGATHQMARHAKSVEVALLKKVEEYRDRVVHLTCMVEMLEFSDGNDEESMGERPSRGDETAIPDVSVLDATFRRNDGVADDESMLHEMEEARLLNVDENEVLFMSEISHDNTVSGWLQNMDISNVDDAAVVEVKTLQSSLSAALERIEGQVTTIRALEGEVDDLKRKQQHDNVTIREVRATLSTKEMTIAELQTKLKSAERNLRSLQESVSTTPAPQTRTQDDGCIMDPQRQDEAMQRAEDEIKDLRNAVAENEGTISALQGKLEAAEGRMAQKQVEVIQRAEEEIQDLRNAAAENQGTISMLQRKLEAAEGYMAQKQVGVIQQAEKEIQELRNAVAENQVTISVLQSKLEAAEAYMAQKNVELTQRAEEEILELRNTVAENEGTISELQSKLEAAEGYMSEAEHMQNALEEAEGEIDRLRAAYLACNDRLAAAFEAMATNEDLIGKFKESSDEAVRSSVDAAESARETSIQLASQIVNLEKELERTKGLLRQKETENNQLEALKKETHENLEETRKTLVEVTQERNACKTSLRDLEIKLVRMTAERNAIEHELDAASKIRMELEAKIRLAAVVEFAKNDLTKKLDSTVESLMKTTSERDSLKIDHTMMVEKLAAAEAREAHVLDELSTAKASHNEVLRRHADLVSQLRTSSATNADKVVELEEKVVESNAEVSRMRNTFMDLNDRIAALIDEKVQSAAMIDSLKETLSSTEADLVEREEKVDAKTTELEKVWSELRQAADEGLNNQEEIIRLRSQLEEAQAEQESLRQALTKAEQSVERATVEFTAYKRCMEDRISERQTVVCEIQSFSESKQRDLRERIAAMQTSKDELLNEVSNALENFGIHLAESSGDLQLSFERQATWQESLKNVTTRAASDICSTTNALSETRDALETMQQAFSEKTELANRNGQERDDAYSRLVFMTGKLEEASRDQESARVVVAEREALLLEHRQEVAGLQTRVEQLESKNLKLRDYIRKLTSKCEEWQESWEQQNRIILELRNS